ncbi:MAG: hypothetical protein ISN28_04615 [Ectothiorhodospiraceae bacterium AqS1]|nr:hypothetical protein [Ectothiorhodospiraceae bacterium AqS1]
MILELRDEKIERLEAGRPFVRLEVKAMSAVVSVLGEKPYGVKRVCKAWRMSSSTVYRYLKAASGDFPLPRRPGPDGDMSDAELTESIEQVEQVLLGDSTLHCERLRKVHARLG